MDDDDPKATEVGTHFVVLVVFLRQTLFNHVSFLDPLVTKHRYSDLPLALISWNKPVNDGD